PIAVGAGRPAGTPLPGQSGRVTAAPVLFKIADLLGPASADSGFPPPPAEVVRAARRDLPPALRRLDPPQAADAARKESGPRILYPPDGAVVAWDGASVPLEASGKGPLHWLVDGRP